MLAKFPDVTLSVAGSVCEVLNVPPAMANNVKLLGFVDDLAQAHVLFGAENAFVGTGLHGFFDELVTSCWRTRGFGDFWGHMLVARGAAHVMIEPELSMWDVAALEPIVSEAGGRLTHLDGSSWKAKGSCVTTCGSLHGEVVRLATAP